MEEIFDVQLLSDLRFPEVIGFQQETIQHTSVAPPAEKRNTPTVTAGEDADLANSLTSDWRSDARGM